VFGDLKDTADVSLYHETSDNESIQSKLDALSSGLGKSWDHNGGKGVLACFAHLETRRGCFRREKDNVGIVVDVADWGYRVGEIEVVVTERSKVPAAVRRIEDIAKDLSRF